MKTVLVTGAASGIGLAVARRFASEGWQVGLADVDLEAALRAAEGIGRAYALDVRDRGQWQATLDAFAEHSGGRLDCLVNNAGIARFGWFDAMPAEEVELQFAINVLGVANGCQLALPLLRATPGARIVNIASCAALFGSPRLAAYSATKFAVRGLSEALDVEYARYGVAVKCVMPWFVETPILDSTSASGNQTIRDFINETGQPVCKVEEAAETVWQAVHADAQAHIVGKAGKSLRFAARFMPERLRKRLKAGVTATPA